MRVSSFIETAPVGVSSQPHYLNGAVVGRCALGPKRLLAALMRIERQRGRERPYARAPRTLDLDLVLMGGLVVNEPGLDVPHPRFRARRFVLGPLASIAPDLTDPVTGRTVGDLLTAFDSPPSAGGWAEAPSRRGVSGR
jgi:2-amino-4-hydroxy-6-hydroxymethyldihydropteridine diphosphokinase